MDTNLSNRQQEKNEVGEAARQDEANFNTGKLYLLDDYLFFKYHHLLDNSTNYDYLVKVKGNPLIYGKRFYPITFNQLESLKKNILNGQQKFSESKKSSSPPPEEKADSIATSETGAPRTDQDSPTKIDGTSASVDPSSDSLPEDPSLMQRPSEVPRRDHKRQKRVIWKPEIWETYPIKKRKDQNS